MNRQELIKQAREDIRLNAEHEFKYKANVILRDIAELSQRLAEKKDELLLLEIEDLILPDMSDVGL